MQVAHHDIGDIDDSGWFALDTKCGMKVQVD